MLLVVLATMNSAYADQSVTYLGLDDLYTEAPKENSYEWKMVLNGTSWEEGTSKSVGFNTKLQTKLKFQFNQKFNVKLEGGLSWFSDNSQYALTEYGSSDFIFAREASLNFNIFKNLTISAGSLNQDFLSAPLLISGGRSFPGLKQTLSIKKKQYEVGLVAQQLIPTSTAFNDERSEEEEIPTFYTGTLFADLNFKNPLTNLPTAKLTTHLALSYFQFNDLPSITADRGGLYGHSGDTGIGANSRFKYEFSGYVFEPSILLEDENNYELKVGGYWADNVEAEENDRIQNIYIEAEKTISSYAVGMRVENFFKDSEASPAVYSSGHYGGNNREGMLYEMSLELKKYNFKILAQYIDSKLISENAVQNNRNAYYLGVETLYVKF